MTKLALIDADALCYHSSRDLLVESLEVIDEKIKNIFEKTEATHYVMFVSNSPYFRHKIAPNYKMSRSKYQTQLQWLGTLKKYLIEGYGAQSIKECEADDAISYFMNQDICVDNEDEHFELRGTFESALDYCKQDCLPEFTFESVEKVMCAVDKDLLQNIPGKHFNYTYKLEEKGNPDSVIKGWWVETSREDSQVNFWKSMITGDSTDNISGIPGRGKVYADKLLEKVNHPSVQSIIASEYQVKFGTSQGIYEFQKNYRLLHMLNCNEDFMREVGEIPMMPQVREVPKKEDVFNLENLNF
jgi:5'-3' exonuclease